MKKEYLSLQTAEDFCRSLAMLLHAGIGLADGVFLLAQEETGEYQRSLKELGQRLDEGASLSEGMAAWGAFEEYVVGMIRVGESTGRLEDCLESLAVYFEERRLTRQKLRSAVAYPSAILALMLVVIGVLLIRVLPVFDGVYAFLGGRLTGVAGGLLYLGQQIKAALPVLFGFLLAMTVLALAVWAYPPFGQRWGAWLRGHFGDRGVLRKFNNARFARALAMGLGSGMQIQGAMELAAMLLGGIPSARRRCEACRIALEGGVSLAQALEQAEFLDAANARLLTVGMRGGQEQRVMEQIADRLSQEAAESLDAAISRIEPAMVLSTSVLVGAILLAVMLPLMNILSAVG